MLWKQHLSGLDLTPLTAWICNQPCILSFDLFLMSSAPISCLIVLHQSLASSPLSHILHLITDTTALILTSDSVHHHGSYLSPCFNPVQHLLQNPSLSSATRTSILFRFVLVSTLELSSLTNWLGLKDKTLVGRIWSWNLGSSTEDWLNGGSLYRSRKVRKSHHFSHIN